MSAMVVEGLEKRFAGFAALGGVDLAIGAGELVGLIGPNGSGKSTFLGCVGGQLRPSAGRVRIRGRETTGWPADRIWRLGVGRTFQLLSLFPGMSVREHLLLAQQERGGGRLGRLWRGDTADARRRADGALERVGLGAWAGRPAEALSYGQQKLLDLGMALVAEPEILLFDEPLAGVNPTLIEALVEHIRALHRAGTTIVLVEHNLGVVMRLCPRLVVLAQGRVVADGPPEAVRRDPEVIAAYFGSDAAA